MSCNKKTRYLFVILSLVFTTRVHAAEVNITSYGAIGNGVTLNTAAIQRAIDDCAKNNGGKVIFPEGRFLSGTIVLKSNVTLLLRKDAVLLASTDLNDYQNLDPFVEGLGTPVGWALIAAVDVMNVGIEGEGMIDGQGAAVKAKQILTDNRPEGQRWGRRPFLLRVVRCNGVKISGVSLLYSAAWTSHYFQSRNISISNIKLLSVGVAHNDGIDIDGCQDVDIKNSDIESGDDALCFKTTSSKMPCSNVLISGMRLKSNQGAIKMGTESMAAFEHIKIANCYIYDTKNGGIKLLSVDGAHLHDIGISDITMVEVRTPILIRLGSRLSIFRKGEDIRQQTGTLEDVTIRNVKAKAADNAQLMPPSGILITGIPGHNIKNLKLENIAIQLAGGGNIENSRQVVPEAIDQYPEVKTFGPVIPAYGIWARHVEGLKLYNISFTIGGNDMRPVFVCEDGKDIELNGWTVPKTTKTEAIIRLEHVTAAVIMHVDAKSSDAASFVRVEGSSGVPVKLVENSLVQGVPNVTIVN
ncbi:glycoside hydrolase family 28 protein [Mucilaginibacter sp. HMF5004]|uniref:glycoside hydrolase family 28 protein n=1 Tax=Mucilaginibacter rivuli TaxID=2857527 RepID=UPI001C5F745C|nr:glycosyl hydrolase family 28 protein [Mucilaginibacter rivuli]MBW4889219.1 glycoside hydrolase family 28 protein [Mucilaginibacter rivuli]